MPHFVRGAIVAGMLAALAASLCCEARASGRLRTVALTGRPAPGTDATFSRWFRGDAHGAPVLNDHGQATFRAHLSDGSIGLWSEREPTTLSLVARSGEIAPGTDQNFGSIGIAHLNNSGQTALVGSFRRWIDDVPAPVDGLWAERANGQLELVTRIGDPAPGAAGEFADFFATSFSDAGDLAFRGEIVGEGVEASNNTGIWIDRASGGLELLARTGDPIPGGGASFSRLRGVGLGSSGHVLFSGDMTGSGIDESNNTGIWRERPGQGIELVLQEGDAAPGADAAFSDISWYTANSRGEIAVTGVVSGPGIGVQNDRGVWKETAGGFSLVVREGAPAPGTSAHFGHITQPLYNDLSRTAFTAVLVGDGVSVEDSAGIWSEGHGGTLTLVARKGDVAPGTTAHFSVLSRPALNERGQIAFHGELAGPGVGVNSNLGIWAQDATGVLHLIARRGGLLDVSDDPRRPDMRTIGGLGFVSGGQLTGLSDDGEVAFLARFTDGTIGVFVSELVAVPEPACGTLMLMGGGVAWILGRRGRKK